MCRGVLLSSPRQQTRSQRPPRSVHDTSLLQGGGFETARKTQPKFAQKPCRCDRHIKYTTEANFQNVFKKKKKTHTHIHTHTLWHTSLKLYHLKHFKVRRATEFFCCFCHFFSFASQKGIKQWCWWSNGGRVQLLNRSRRPCNAAQHLHSGYCPKAAS